MSKNKNPDKKESILFISSEFPPGPGGIGTHSFYLVRYLLDAGYKVKVVTEKRKGYSGDIPVLDVSYLERNRFLFFIRFFGVVLRELLSGHQYVIISGTKSIFLGSLALVISWPGHLLLSMVMNC